ncbi:RuBisCO operon transcriptional regulator CbbR [hydrothermal vent metagenome]|uniref:RuBisCO operon transcriptional regulator CbbR n=1 Tax=hydrothermal vent metagenome TaxID=652676 RepID=A0A3B0Y0I8_9ZZZZ
MHVTLRQIQVFEAVASKLNYTRASEELHLSQPAVSMQIKQLEKTVGINLFEKIGKKVTLTEAGRELHHYARQIQNLLGEASEVLEALKGVRRGHLSLSVASTANYFATNLLANFKRQYPETTFNLDVTNRKILLSQLEHNETDIVVMGRPPIEAELIAEPFMENPLVVIAPNSHPLRHNSHLAFDDLQNETFVVRELGSGTRIAMEQFFTENGMELKTGIEMNSNEAIKQAVEAGLGLGIVSIHTLSLELAANKLCLLDVKGFPVLRHWYLVHRADKRLSAIMIAFKEFVFAEAGGLLELAGASRPKLLK